MKYMGSKARFAKDILPIILKDRKGDWQYYVEPFVGGANTIDKVGGNRIGNDLNQYLISMWIALQNGWTPPTEVSKEDYQKVLDNKEAHLDSFVGWVGFNCSYSGKFLSGYAGKTKTKIGTVRDYQAEAHKNIAKQLPLLKDVYFKYGNYYDLEIPPESIIYCDPPYQGTSKYNKIDSFDHEKFWAWCDMMVDIGHTVFVSEYSAPKGWKCVWSKEVKSSLSANGRQGGNKLSVEKLFTKS